MNRSLFKAIFISTLITSEARAQIVYEITATKRMNYRQTGIEQVEQIGTEFRLSIEGENLSADFPREPRVVTAPNGAKQNCVFGDGAWLGITSFLSEPELDQKFPDGSYNYTVGDFTFDLSLTGPYPAMPIA